MTFEQAQIYIRLFILQHYDENIEDVIPDVNCKGKASDMYVDEDGDWENDESYIFWARRGSVSRHGRVCLESKESENGENFNILDYVKLEDET